MTLAQLNALPPEAFVAVLGGVFEHARWVAEAVLPARPFASRTALHAAMVAAVSAADADRQHALLCAHPELAAPAVLTAESAAEQGALGLDRLDAATAARFAALNRAYRARFGFPFVIAVRGQRDPAMIAAAMTARLEHTPDAEMPAALAEVAAIAGFRLERLVDD
jgi:2-oxo-4-hydroxy-4-carboxy-5-ureidoimidazoline decarboxylase